jgi:ribulose-phosphate 3-epimerase
MTIISPSLLSADFGIIKEELIELEQAEADWLHLDIMDGHFVPNLSFGPATVKQIGAYAKIPQDVHLMVQRPQDFAEAFITAGAGNLTLHIESECDLKKLLKHIKQSGLSAGISIKPESDPKALLPYTDLIDLVLVMGVHPGFSGQDFLDNTPQQIASVRAVIEGSGRKIWLEVDGGINKDTAVKAVKAGADAVVAGKAVFGEKDIINAIAQLKAAGGAK